MSGGHFNYADEHAKNEIFGWVYEYGEVKNVFEDREITELVWDVFDLIHDFDWYKSCDTSKETYIKKKTAFKKKWLKNSGVRVRRIVDEAIDEVRRELYETYGFQQEESE